jgi:hypothetical protein
MNGKTGLMYWPAKLTIPDSGFYGGGPVYRIDINYLIKL